MSEWKKGSTKVKPLHRMRKDELLKHLGCLLIAKRFYKVIEQLKSPEGVKRLNEYLKNLISEEPTSTSEQEPTSTSLNQTSLIVGVIALADFFENFWDIA